MINVCQSYSYVFCFYVDVSHKRSMAILKDSPEIKFHQEDIPADLVATGDGLTQEYIEQKLGELIHSSLETVTAIFAEKIEADHWEWKIRIGGDGKYLDLNSRIAYHILRVISPGL